MKKKIQKIQRAVILSSLVNLAACSSSGLKEDGPQQPPDTEPTMECDEGICTVKFNICTDSGYALQPIVVKTLLETDPVGMQKTAQDAYNGFYCDLPIFDPTETMSFREQSESCARQTAQHIFNALSNSNSLDSVIISLEVPSHKFVGSGPENACN